MAVLGEKEGMLVVPQGKKELAPSFATWLWDREVPCYLVQNDWVSMPEDGETGLGLRVAPGSA